LPVVCSFVFLQEATKALFDSIKQEIIGLMDEMGIEPSTDFEQEVVCEDSDTFRMSADRMRKLSDLQEDVCISYYI